MTGASSLLANYRLSINYRLSTPRTGFSGKGSPESAFCMHKVFRPVGAADLASNQQPGRDSLARAGDRRRILQDQQAGFSQNCGDQHNKRPSKSAFLPIFASNLHRFGRFLPMLDAEQSSPRQPALRALIPDP